MAERIFLHIGAPKSGTTFLQTVLWANRHLLRHDGVLVPGRVLFDGNRAAVAVRSTGPRDRRAPPGSPRAVWRSMQRRMRSWPGDAVLSNEWFTLAGAEQAARTVQGLGPAEVHVVFTARDFTRQVPAAWQEMLKLGHSSSLPDFIAGLDRDGERWSWSTMDAAEALARWGSGLPADRVHVVTVPPLGADPGLLWRRFATVCGIDADSVDLNVARANESLSTEAAALLQRMGPALREAVDADTAPWTEQYRWLRRYVAHQLLAPVKGSRIALRDDEAATLRARSLRSVEAVRAAGYDVVGDLADLTSCADATEGKHPDDVTAAEMLDLLVPTTAALLRRLRDESTPPDRDSPRAPLDEEPEPGPPSATPVGSRLHRPVGWLRRRR